MGYFVETNVLEGICFPDDVWYKHVSDLDINLIYTSELSIYEFCCKKGEGDKPDDPSVIYAKKCESGRFKRRKSSINGAISSAKTTVEKYHIQEGCFNKNDLISELCEDLVGDTKDPKVLENTIQRFKNELPNNPEKNDYLNILREYRREIFDEANTKKDNIISNANIVKSHQNEEIQNKIRTHLNITNMSTYDILILRDAINNKNEYQYNKVITGDKYDFVNQSEKILEVFNIKILYTKDKFAQNTKINN